MTLINDLKSICKEVKGNVLTIGNLPSTVEDALEKNNCIENGYILVFDKHKKVKDKNKNKGKNKRRNFSIKKLRKSFVKKSVDYIICNYNEVEKYMRFFVKDSVYINRGKLYIYGLKSEFTIDDIESYYKRYNTKINITEYTNEFLIEIDNSNAKNNWLKDKLYKIKDTIIYYINVLGDILIG